MNDTVEIHNPDRDRTLRVPRRLFPGRLAAKGWQLVAGQPAPEEDQSPTPVDEDGLNAALDEKTQLRAILDDRGVEYDGRLGIKRLRELVERTA